MKDIEIRELFRNREEYAGKEIVVRGWVRGNRASNQFGFISLNDGTFFTPLQVVYEASKIDNYEEISKVHLAAGVMVKGVLELTPGAQQPFELKATEVTVEADSLSDYPLQKKRHTM
ncbi:MAG: OB-fold nucleic acid binding domain-containing protein, partial [Mogibacterium sp.]|nr:OB-fold nucleic acid binding domain-containing protein [Mogibacterium sp.]